MTRKMKCFSLDGDLEDNLDKVWCFLENIRDPLVSINTTFISVLIFVLNAFKGGAEHFVVVVVDYIKYLSIVGLILIKQCANLGSFLSFYTKCCGIENVFF